MTEPTVLAERDPAGDFAASRRARRQSWYGAKRYVKRSLSYRVPHLLMRTGARLYPGHLDRHRLPAPAHVRSVTARMAGVKFAMVRPDRCVVAKELYWGRGRRPRPADQLALDVFAGLARDARLILDIGAYTGIFALLGARVAPDAQVHAFEIIPACAQGAIDNVVANDLLTRVQVHVLGVGEDGGSIVVPPGDSGSALPDFLSSSMHFENGVRVGLVGLDTFVAGLDVAAGPVVLKIDVEGAENIVLAGATTVLAGGADILCEILPEAEIDAVAGALAPHGYRQLLVTDTVLRPCAALYADHQFRDWVFTRRSDAELRAVGIPVAD